MIISSDLHIWPTKLDAPYRKGDIVEDTKAKLRFIFKLAAEESDRLLVLGGDVFHVPDTTWLATFFIKLMMKYKVTVVAVPGQHDMPSHSMKLLYKSAFDTLRVAGMYMPTFKKPIMHGSYIFYGFPYGAKLKEPELPNNNHFPVAIWHHMVISKPLWKGQEADKGIVVLKKNKTFKLIVTGDNHQTFIRKSGDRWLINPGTLIRRDITEADHIPCVFRYYPGMSEPEKIVVPHSSAEEAFNLDAYTLDKTRQLRSSKFMKTLSDPNKRVTVSFKKNMKIYVAKHKELRSGAKKMLREVTHYAG